MVAFLRSRPAEEIASMGEGFGFKPVVDGSFLKDSPHNLYKSGRFQNIDIITGCTSHEGYYMCRVFLAGKDLCTTRKSLMGHVQTAVSFNYTEGVSAISQRLYHHYISDESVGSMETFRREYVDMVSDMIFIGPNFTMAIEHSGKCEMIPNEGALSIVCLPHNNCIIHFLIFLASFS